MQAVVSFLSLAPHVFKLEEAHNTHLARGIDLGRQGASNLSALRKSGADEQLSYASYPQAGCHGGRPRQWQRPTALPATARPRAAYVVQGSGPRLLRYIPPASPPMALPRLTICA